MIQGRTCRRPAVEGEDSRNGAERPLLFDLSVSLRTRLSDPTAFGSKHRGTIIHASFEEVSSMRHPRVSIYPFRAFAFAACFLVAAASMNSAQRK